MDYRLLLTFWILNSAFVTVTSKYFTFEAEHFAPAAKRVPRSSATGNFSVHLHDGELIQIEFCLRKTSVVTVLNVVYSNDGPADAIHVTIDNSDAGRFETRAMQDKGNGWNQFKSSMPLKRAVPLQTGRHVINIKVSYSDEWGVEIDNLVLDIDDDLISYEDIVCNLYCFDINYDDVPKVDTIPSGRFVKKSAHTRCSEQDNVKVEIYHNMATRFEISANLPKYVSFANNRDPNYSNCKLASPYWIFREQNVTTGVSEVQGDGAIMRSSGTSIRTVKIVTFNFRSITPTREIDERLIGSTLYLKLRNLHRENVRVQVEYKKARRWVTLQVKEFTPFNNEGNWSIPERTWEIADDNEIKLTIEPGKQRVIIETLKLEGITKQDSTVELYSDHDVVFQGVRLGVWHHRTDHPGSMTVYVQSGTGKPAELFQIDSVRIYSRVPWTGGYAQVFVMFQDGRVRLQATTPHGLDYVPFGSSVYVGQPTLLNQDRPYSPVQKVNIYPRGLQLAITYADKSTALFKLELTYKHTKLIVSDAKFTKNRDQFPIMTFQSMWTHDGNADVDHVTINGDDSRHIMSDWDQLFGVNAVFFRRCISEHNTQGPDITIAFT